MSVVKFIEFDISIKDYQKFLLAYPLMPHGYHWKPGENFYSVALSSIRFNRVNKEFFVPNNIVIGKPHVFDL